MVHDGPADTMTTLAALKHGDRALVLGIDHSRPQLVAKLAARGLVPGVEIGVLRGGDPLLLSVDDCRWALNRSDAELVQVDLIKRARKRFRLARFLS
jgi:Fe2+ transport system protein FeoA